MPHLLNVALVSSLLFGLWKLLKIGRRERGLPPGPTTVPFFGNALQMPSTFIHLKLSEWAKQFGDMYSIKVVNKTFVVISGPKAVRDVFDKQGLLSGGRPPSHIGAITTGPLYMPLVDMSTNTWKKGRKQVHNLVSEELLQKYLPIHESGSLSFLKDVLESPQDINTHLQKMMVSNMQHQIFGKPCASYENDTPQEFFDSIKMLNECLDIASQPPVDVFPFLKWIPERWAAWKTKCKTVARMRLTMWERLLSEGEKGITDGNGNGCYLETILRRNKGPDVFSRDEILYLIGVMLDTGAETTTSFLQTVLLALINFPECQDEARKELDKFIPADRLPVLDDLNNLTYLQALINEVHRFRPLFTVGLPHYTTGDISYDGYRIPKGTTLLLNTWHLHHDPELYDDPESFNPERFMRSKFGTKIGVDTTEFRTNYGFGAGRRICPGEHAAGRIVALNAMRWLWAFEFSKDESGTGHITMDAYGKGIELAPLPFSCRVVPRKGREEVIRRL